MRPSGNAALACSLTLCVSLVGAQMAPSTSAPADPLIATAASSDTPQPTVELPANAPSASISPPNRKLSPPLQMRAAAHGQHHWLRWAIIGVATVMGVVAFLAYRKNRCHGFCPGPLP